MNDATKLHWIAALLERSSRLILCVTDEASVKHLRGMSWQGQALKHLGVEIEVAEIPDDIRARIHEAQTRQRR